MIRPVLLLLALSALAGCDAILGIGDHTLAASADSGGPNSGSSSTSGISETAGGDAGNAGGAVASLLCGDSGTCVVGAIESVGRVPAEGGAGTLPDGSPVTLFDDGFEQGGTSCDPTGMDCVTGALSP
ncbi:MAG TPA: hypothetical protein VEK07_15850 [Polyangiaceae bacterium]|nr:hypothetical protein [Polyangiaceae bacterium]